MAARKELRPAPPPLLLLAERLALLGRTTASALDERSFRDEMDGDEDGDGDGEEEEEDEEEDETRCSASNMNLCSERPRRTRWSAAKDKTRSVTVVKKGRRAEANRRCSCATSRASSATRRRTGRGAKRARRALAFRVLFLGSALFC